MLAAMVAFSGIVGGPQSAHAMDRDRVAHVRDAVVLVQQGDATCAGARLPDGRIATAYHCVAGGFGARVTTRDGQMVRARVEGTDPAHDLAVLVPKEPIPGASLSIRTTGLEVAEAIVIVGHPYAGAPPAGFLAGTLRWSVASGTVAAVGERSLQLDVTLGPGNSGGPVVDETGAIVGIVSRRIGSGIGFASRIEPLQALLDAPRKPKFGGTLSAAPAGWGTQRLVLGIDVEATWRNRLVLSTQLGVPVSPAQRTLFVGEVQAPVGLVRLGGRQPLGTGPGTPSIDVFGAVGLTRRWTARDDGPPQVNERVDAFVGVGLGRGGFRVDVGRRLTEGQGNRWLFGLRLGLGLLRRVF